MNMCAVSFLWFNREVLVLAWQQHASSSHAVHCDLRSARICVSSSLQTSSGHGTGLHAHYACYSLFCFFFSFFLLLFFLRTHSQLLAGWPDAKHRKKTAWRKMNCWWTAHPLLLLCCASPKNMSKKGYLISNLLVAPSRLVYAHALLYHMTVCMCVCVCVCVHRILFVVLPSIIF